LKRKFVTNLVLIILLNLLIKPFWIFGIDRTVQNMTGEDIFGMYSALLSFSFLINILLDLGITNYNNRNISQNHQLLSKYFANIVVLKLILAVLYTAVAFIVASILGYDAFRMKLLIFLVINQFLTSFTLYLRSNIAGMQMHIVNSLVSVLDRGLMMIFCAVLIWGNIMQEPFKIEWFVYSQSVAYLLTMLFCFGIVLWKSKFPRLKFDRKFFIVILRQSFPYALLVLLMSAYTRIDQVMLDHLLRPKGEGQVGIYVHGFRLFDAAYQFAMLFAVLLLPMFSKMIKEKVNVQELTRLSSLLLFVPSIVLAFSSLFYQNEIIDLMYYKPDAFGNIDVQGIERSASAFSVLMFAFLGMASTIIYGTLLTANGNLGILNITSAAAVFINIVLNLLLIPKYMAVGAAIAAVSTQGFVGLTQYFIAAKKFGMKPNAQMIFKLAVFTAGVFALGLGSQEVNADWGLRFLGMITASIILAFALNLIDLKAMVKLVLNKSEL
jgi:O-antigen/teichoic acid export membrane protein